MTWVDTFEPTYLIEISGKRLSKDITDEIQSFAFEEVDDAKDVLELTICDRNLQFVDDPLFQEGNEIHFRFGYAGNLSDLHIAIIEDIEYDFPDGGMPTVTLKAYDKSTIMAKSGEQKVWQAAAPGLRYSDVATQIAQKHGLTPIVTETHGKHLRIPQDGVTDAKFLKTLAGKARTADGKGGFVYFVQGNELHFHPKGMDDAPGVVLEYFIGGTGTLRSFKPKSNKQESDKSKSVKAVGVDPRAKKTVTHTASNDTETGRDTLGDNTMMADKQSFSVDADSGQGRYK